ncbi:GNAT family N-acetyltransferase [Bacillus sp. P14.5]|uniref:GNAT family N-acetyltransferase n=1 Tax=Bacillus sp. P14.5 TaxID=1983400 RepID=UPI000DEA8B53|nr:GNAT family N-acetyltransferase [Bacillus sp. P14.5]
MEVVKSMEIHHNMWNLLSFATSEKNINQEYNSYIKLPTKKLYSYFLGDESVGCIGIELFSQRRCEIKHIAVSPKHRNKSVGSKMINFILDKYSFATVLAETDSDAVNFYKNYGFKITSLGEKYPGVERFQCTFIND